MKKTRLIILSLLTLILPMKTFAQQAKQIKVSEINVSYIKTLEERTFLIHTIIEKGYFCYANTDHENTIDIYVANDAPDELSDFDFFYDNILSDQLDEFSYLDKNMRGELYIQWRQEIDDDVNRVLFASFMRNAGRTDNATCETAAPFCTDQGAYLFPAGVNSGSPCGSSTTADCGEPYKCSNTPGQSSSCLYTAPNPAFYYLKIDEPGNLNIYMESTPRVDIDFDCWGPFDNMETACDELACSNIVDCSYSTSATENCHINNAQHEEFYILLITNYSNDSCNITFENRGTGTTDCGILPPLVDNDGPFCTGETIHLSAHGQSGATYSWNGPNGFTSTEQNPTLYNATTNMSGDYTCTITLAGETNHATTEVIVAATPEPTASAQPSSVNYGSTTQLSVDPGVQGNFNYHWEPENMVVDPNAQNTQTVELTSSQTFTVSVINTIAGCNGTAEVTVAVGSGLSATATADEYTFCEGNSTTLHVNPINGTGNYSYSWEPAEFLNNANIQNPVATPAVGNITFTCHVNDGMVTRDATVTIHVNPNSEPYDIYEAICPGDTYYFYGEAVTTACDKNHMDYNQYGCDSLVRLHLSLNPSWDMPIEQIDTCDFFEWNPNGKTILSHNYEHEVVGNTITQEGTYQRTYESVHGCDSIVTIKTGFEYTPNPYDSIMSPDASIGVATHSVIVASEFQINTYDFTIREQGQSAWKRVEWSLKDQNGNDVEWLLETDTTGIGQTLHLTVFKPVDGRVYLSATAINDCGRKTVTHWLECTFYGIDEGESPVNVDIVPNPNNGQMTLNFERFTGNVNVKVYNMSGELIDNFETRNEMEYSTMIYNMKQRSAGIYYFVITGKEGSVTKKVVIAQ